MMTSLSKPWERYKALQKGDGDALIKKLTVPRSPTKGNPALRWTPFTASEDFQKFYAYNDQDIVAESAISDRIPDLSEGELEIWRFDQRSNMRGMFLARPDVENCICIIEQGYAKYNAELAEITGGFVKKASEAKKIMDWCATVHGVRLYDLDEEALEIALAQAYPAAVLRVLRIRQLLAFGSVRKLYAMRAHMCVDDRLRDQYSYAAAHTMLWNGRSVQMANLYGSQFKKPHEAEAALAVIATRSLEMVEAIYGDALECVADCLRSLIAAAPGHKLISADFTAIQAVVTSCLAGEQWRIDTFAGHGKIYEEYASRLTGKPLQYYIDYRKEHKKHHEDRQLGKLATLSGDFGAWINGWKRFGAEKYGDDAFIKSLILKTRGSMPAIVEFWGGQTRDKFARNCRPELYGLEGAAISAVLSPEQCFGYRGVRYQMHEDILYCMPPSGGLLRYHTPRIRPSHRDYAEPWAVELTYMGWATDGGKPAWKSQKLYGGVCTQNVVANVSREFQADLLVALDTAQPRPYPIVMHTHDEGVAEVPDRPEYSVQEYTDIGRASVAAHKWAYFEDGTPWPIKLPTAWGAYRYGKWDDCDGIDFTLRQ